MCKFFSLNSTYHWIKNEWSFPTRLHVLARDTFAFRYMFMVRCSIMSGTALILYIFPWSPLKCHWFSFFTRNYEYYSKCSNYIWILDHMRVNPFPYLTWGAQVRDQPLGLVVRVSDYWSWGPGFESRFCHGDFSLKRKIPMVTMVWVV
jgi:hypothetical protein